MYSYNIFSSDTLAHISFLLYFIWWMRRFCQDLFSTTLNFSYLYDKYTPILLSIRATKFYEAASLVLLFFLVLSICFLMSDDVWINHRLRFIPNNHFGGCGFLSGASEVRPHDKSTPFHFVDGNLKWNGYDRSIISKMHFRYPSFFLRSNDQIGPERQDMPYFCNALRFDCSLLFYGAINLLFVNFFFVCSDHL